MSTKLPDIDQQFAEWYHEVVFQAELADQAPVRGCMVVRPYGYAIWENIQKTLDAKIKETGHHNAAFPVLIPQSFIQKEAAHVAGFSPELAVVTHAGGKELEDPLVVRPTSETIIHYMFARWIKSWRDLPLKINQWCSVVRWEMRTRPFLRTTEFWWQEGHTAHETEDEALKEVLMMLDIFVEFAEKHLAIPVITGLKPESEKFAGADKTYAFEGLMRDGKALQMGTSHLLSQNFAKAFEMKYQDRNGNLAYPYLTSWCGATTRLIGGLIMTHGDQKGLVLPPMIAPVQVVVVPIIKGDAKDAVLKAAHTVSEMLKAVARVHIDNDENETPGAKFYKWELKGVPFRIEIGPRDIAAGQVVVVDRLGIAKSTHNINDLPSVMTKKFAEFQQELYNRALARRQSMWHKAAKLAEFADDLEHKGGFFQIGWCRQTPCEQIIKEHKATIRCVLEVKEFEHCFNCGKPSSSDVLIAKSY